MGNCIESYYSRSIGNSRSTGRDCLRGVSRPLNMIVIHCTATLVNVDFSNVDLLRAHRAKGMRCIGYHFYIRKDGFIHSTRPLEMVGAHAYGFNQESIGIAYEGGLSSQGIPADTRTLKQKRSLRALIRTLKMDYGITQVCGHRDLSPDRNGNGLVEQAEWMKQCPCFDVKTDEWCH